MLSFLLSKGGFDVKSLAMTGSASNNGYQYIGADDNDESSIICYSRESAIAEKFEAMLKLGELNSRMNDFYHIWLLFRQFDFNGDNLIEAIRLTLSHRGTTIPADITAFSRVVTAL